MKRTLIVTLGRTLVVLSFLVTISCIGDDITEVNTQALRGLLDEGKIVLVDTRWEQEYQDGHIPSAINVQRFQIDSIQNFLPEDKETTVVFYCRGYG